MSQDSYNFYDDLPNYSYKIIDYLMDNNELIWKLLYYNSPDAWNQSNLTKAQKGGLVWAGEGDSSDFKVFMDDGSPDVEMDEKTILRIAPYGISPDNRTVGTITIYVEVYSHYKINTLSNYTTRVDVIIQQILQELNGISIDTLGAIGALHFDKLGTSATRMEMAGQLPFRGKWLLMSTKSAKSE